MPTGVYLRVPVRERFNSNFIVDSSGCWNWSGSCFKNGYGQISVNGNPCYAHRVSWELCNGPIPKGMCVCHSCDNPKCVNPSHLWLGSQKENNQDRTRKGRTASGNSNGRRTHPERYVKNLPRGERNGRSKLKDHERKMVPVYYYEHGLSILQIANKFSVTKNCISSILYRLRSKPDTSVDKEEQREHVMRAAGKKVKRRQ